MTYSQNESAGMHYSIINDYLNHEFIIKYDGLEIRIDFTKGCDEIFEKLLYLKKHGTISKDEVQQVFLEYKEEIREEKIKKLLDRDESYV
ncbi:hypothetical protein ABGT15_04295 [Flavobacterium enshiense]|uniref:hypothetical protein n=1 Tax=Flavobacterium enshiense TaxID=1341165 RepID=UPI00345D6F62